MEYSIIYGETQKKLVREHKHKLKLARRKANRKNRQLAKKKKRERIGRLTIARTLTRLAPYNIHGATEYQIKAGITVLCEKTLSGQRIYLGWMFYNSMDEIRKNCKSYIARPTELKHIKGDKLSPQLQKILNKLNSL